MAVTGAEKAYVGAALATAIQHAVPNVSTHYPGQHVAFMAHVMDQLEGMGIPGAAGLRPNTPSVGATTPQLSTADFTALATGTQNSGTTLKR